jgi:hypothetical protein
MDRHLSEELLMSSQLQLCQGCGRPAQQGEEFRAFLPAHAARTEERDPDREIVLCPICAEARQSSGELRLAYHFCDQCAGPVEPGQVELRSKTFSSMASGAPSSDSVTMLLCRRCAARHDGTARWLLVSIGVFIAGLVLLGLVSRLFQ